MDIGHWILDILYLRILILPFKKLTMWWKAASVVLVLYALSVGMLVPLKPGIDYVKPGYARTGDSLRVQFHGYNSFYTHGQAADIRVWLQYDSAQALLGRNLTVLNDTTLEASFLIPANLPRLTASVMLNAIISHPTDGVSLLPDAVEISRDTTARNGESWTSTPVENLHIVKDISYPYRNVIYESIRNTYYHVPMWFVLLFLFTASVIYSVMFLLNKQLDADRKASSFAEAGMLFGIMGLVTGMLWANYTWGAPWSNDIKQLMTAVALLIYLAYFILRKSFDEPEKGARLSAVYNIFAFSSLIPLLYIVPRMFASLHPGSTGNPAFGSQDLDNTMRLVFYPAILGFTGIGFWLAQIRTRLKRIEDKMIGLD
ncbi:MAG TPA: cytochrome c assembly protein [Saprospirales bacterium]|nr:cytochrome c assembly protein [Saprospirales bacterium]